ncbi:hypothetical protein [Pseudomonas putida]|uniref:Uncharacterized protein n=1 Tax=Pseudomonas putida (strain DOT-T1E) TaxID=1196325 RepID=I7B791_PSEPT|nr:hypothetical protein [Pseudomonas putida]AFO47198.1 hypothetical protein T1E_1343 [Pseudomonas putida DOT-T1E]UZM95157.1 hypothetical protein OPZ46_06975 [Pseudomonas putida DOT-T1E]
MSTIKRNLQKLVDRVKLNRRFCADEHHHALADGVQDLLAEIEQLREANEQVCTNYNRVSFTSEERGKQIDQLKAENEELKQNMYYSDQIIETRTRLLKLIPPCPVHGEECVPHAMEWVSAALAKERAQ